MIAYNLNTNDNIADINKIIAKLWINIDLKHNVPKGKINVTSGRVDSIAF